MVIKFPIVQLDSKVSQSCITVQQDMSREYHSPKYQKYQYLKNLYTFQLKLPLSIRWSVIIMCSPQYRSPQGDRGSPRSMKDGIRRLVIVGTPGSIAI